WLLLGAATDSTVRAVGEVASGSSVRLALSTSPDMSAPTFTVAQAPDVNSYARWDVTGLTPGTRYYAALEIDSSIDADWVNTFETDVERAGRPVSFTCGFFSCAPGSGRPASTSLVHDRLGARQYSLNFHLGDFGYPNINTNDPELYRSNWVEQITAE